MDVRKNRKQYGYLCHGRYPAIEYPEWKRPTGAHDAYHKGDKVTYNGKKYISLIDSNTYSPADYPAGWKPVEE